MRIRVSSWYDQVLTLILFAALYGCSRTTNELPVIPPATHPLSREYIGFGVVNSSFTHLYSESGSGGVSQGYLRKGTVVRIIERKQASVQDNAGYWVMVEGNYPGPNPGSGQGSGTESVRAGTATQGWLLESNLDIFDSESRAVTASRAITQ